MNAATINLITNGTFETGDIAGWSASIAPAFGNTSGSCNNAFAARSAAIGCTTGTNPISGTYAAYASTSFPTRANDVGEWDDFLRQTVTVPTGITSAILTWSDTATWSSSSSSTGINVLIALMQGGTYLNNGSQYDLINPGANGTLAWATHSLDVTTLLQGLAGQSIQVQLASLIFYDTSGGTGPNGVAGIVGWDNVQLNVTTPGAPTPEPATLGIMGLGLSAVFLLRRRRA